MRKTAIKKEKRTRLQKSFHQTVLKLYRKKNLDEITINEVCEKVNVPRSSFYYHYNTIRDVLDELENDFLNELRNTLAEVKRNPDNEKETFGEMMRASYPVIKNHELTVKTVSVERQESAFFNRWAAAFNDVYSNKSDTYLRDFALSYSAIHTILDVLRVGVPCAKINTDKAFEIGMKIYELKKDIFEETGIPLERYPSK